MREKEFRSALKAFDFSPYKDAYVALYCSTEALLPAWAHLLVSSHLHQIAKKVVWGTLVDLESAIFQSLIEALDPTPYQGKPVIIKGCADKNIPATAYVLWLKNYSLM